MNSCDLSQILFWYYPVVSEDISKDTNILAVKLQNCDHEI